MTQPKLTWLAGAGLGLLAWASPPEGAGELQAQQQAPWFANLGLGPVVQDRQGSNALNSSGLVIQARAGHRLTPHLAAVLEVTHTSVTRNDVARLQNPTFLAVPCPGAPVSCGAPGEFQGPSRSLIAGAGFQLTAGHESAAVFASFAPGVYWLYDRAPGTRPVSAGIGAGIGGSVRIMAPVWAVLDVHYHRLFTDGSNPRWLVPVGIGLQVHL
jgi:hypothetical protein